MHFSQLLRWLRIVVLAAALLAGGAAGPLHGQTVSPGETPVGFSTDAWQRIQVQIEAEREAPAADVWLASERAKLTASGAQASDRWGTSVALDGDTAVVGAYHEDSESGEYAGAVYIFGRNEGGSDNWGLIKRITGSDSQAYDYFGYAVALDGDTVLVGAPYEGGMSHGPLFGIGAAYIFERNQGGSNNWGEVTKLTGSGTSVQDQFGQELALDGNTVLIAAGFYFDTTTPPSGAGRVYIFERDQGGVNNWNEVKILTASDGQLGDLFGTSLALDGDTALIGSEADAAYVFERSQGGANNWGEVKILTAADTQPDDDFGTAVALDGDTALIGARSSGDADVDPFTSGPGAAYVFGRNQGRTNNWGEVKRISASDAQSGDGFGVSVALDGDTALVGAHGEDGEAGDPYLYIGASYLFRRNEAGVNNWGEVSKFNASETQTGDSFGVPVALHGDTALVGATSEDGGPGDPVSDAGAVYVFQLTQVTILPSAFLPMIGSEE